MSAHPAPRRPTIVVGVDGSDGANHALDWAVEEARLRHCTLEVVHAWAPPVPISAIGARVNPIDPALYEHAAEEILERSLRTLSTFDAAAAVHVEPRLLRGYTSTVLLDRLADADLLVVGSRGRGGFGGLLLGSVSQRCVEHSAGPVAVIRSGKRSATGRVVVGVDGSEGSWHALRWAHDEASLRATRLSVVHAWAPPRVPQPVGVVVKQPLSADYAAPSEKLLHAMVDGIVPRGPQRPTAIDLLPIAERPAIALVSCSHDAGLLVVGSRGHGGFMGLLLGSVSQQCLHHASCPIVIVPNKTERSETDHLAGSRS